MSRSNTTRFLRFALCLGAMTLAIWGSASPSNAQSPVQLSIAIPTMMQPVFTRSLMERFEKVYPEVYVDLRYTQDTFPKLGSNIHDYLDKLQHYAASADVLWAGANVLSPLATRSGDLLDLTPLLAGSPDFDSQTYQPQILQAFQWDNATWAFPIETNPTVIAYVAAEFDRLGLAYPNSTWTIDDFARTVRAIGQNQPEQGSRAGVGIYIEAKATLLRTFLGHGFYAETSNTDTIAIHTPQLAALLQQWIALENDGRIDTTYDVRQVPLQVTTMGEYPLFSNSPQAWAWSLLPGGSVVLNTTGFAVSRGTAYPEYALKLAMFLADQPEVWRGGIAPKRADLVTSVARYPSPLQDIASSALEKAIPDSELRYANYVNQAIEQGKQDSGSIDAVLGNLEFQSTTDLRIAADQKAANVALTIATPIPTPNTTQKIVLKFGGDSYIVGMSFPAQQKLIDDFVNSDPDVAQIVFRLSNQENQAEQAERYDCFVKRGNAVPTADTSQLLNLDPLITADPDFSKDDLVTDMLPQLQREGKTWAIPLYIHPFGLVYDPKVFAIDGIPLPERGWTISEFVAALQTLKENTGKPAYHPGYAASYILALIAAYGGLPFDYQTDPPTLRFSEPETIEAIRQALNLIKQGYINGFKKFRFADSRDLPSAGTAVIEGADGLSPLLFSLLNRPENKFLLTNWTLYPKGSKYQPILYEIGTAYISAHAQNPQACYRWISVLRKHPEVLAGLPAYKSVLNDPNFPLYVGQAFANQIQPFYASLGKLDTVFIPSDSMFGNEGVTASNRLQFNWLYAVFDDYLAGGTELESALKEAEMFTNLYLDCVRKLSVQRDDAEEFKQAARCAVQADPGLRKINQYFSELQ